MSILDVLTFSPLGTEVFAGKVISVSIERGAVSIVYASGFLSSLRVRAHRTYRFVPDSYPTADEVASSAALFSDEYGIGRASLSLCLPDEWVVFRSHEFPLAVGDNLRKVIAYSMDSITPFKEEDVFFDYALLGLREKYKVVVAASKKKLVSGYIDALSGENMTVKNVSFDTSCLETLYRYTAGIGRVLPRSFGKGFELKAADINRKIGGIGEGKGAEDISFAALGGAIESLWPKAGGINMLSLGLHEPRKRPVALTAALSVLMILLLAVYFAMPARIEARRLSAMKTRVSAMEGEVKKALALQAEIARVSNDINITEDFKGSVRTSVSIINELTNIIPKNTWLYRIRVSEGMVYMEGYSGSVTELVKVLEASKFFEVVEHTSPTYRDARMKADRFSIKVRLERVLADEKKK